MAILFSYRRSKDCMVGIDRTRMIDIVVVHDKQKALSLIAMRKSMPD